MARYPGATFRPLKENTTEPAIKATQLILHSAVSNSDSLHGYFNRDDVDVESHFYVQDDGGTEQYIDTSRQADANYKANQRAISIETWDARNPDKEPWTQAQLLRLADIAAWAHREHDIPLVRAPRWDAPGVGGHTDYPDHWTNVRGKTCPGLARRNQVNVVIEMAKAILKGTAPQAPTTPAEEVPRTSPAVPAFPLPVGWYFGPRTGPKESVSGYYTFRSDLRVWQQKMKSRGWNIDVDGLYGSSTADVVKKFQAEKRLTVDGKIGAQTWRAAWTSPVS